MRREISFEDQEWFLHTHSGRFAETQLADLENREWNEASPTVDFLLNAGTFLLMLSPVLIVLLFKVL